MFFKITSFGKSSLVSCWFLPESLATYSTEIFPGTASSSQPCLRRVGMDAYPFSVPTECQGARKQDTPVHSSEDAVSPAITLKRSSQFLWHFLLSSSILITNPGKWLVSSSHLTDKKTEAQKGEVTCPRSFHS